MLPTDCIDIILNFSGDIVYETDSCRISAAPFHINGLRRKHTFIQQAGNLQIFGISLYPFGLYPFINKSLSCIKDRVVDLYELSAALAKNLESAIINGVNVENAIENIQKALCFELHVTKDYINKAKLIQDYLELGNDATLQSFCAEHEIHIKALQRYMLQYTGYTPKILRSIKRFQKIGNSLVFQKASRLLDIAHDYDFADQAHFIREFRKFSGAAPRAFGQEKVTIKENVEYIYK